MGRFFLITLAVAVAAISGLRAQPPPDGAGPPPQEEKHEKKGEGKKKWDRPSHRPPPLTKEEHEELRRAIDQLPKEARELLHRNLRLLNSMPPERREAIKGYAEQVRVRIRKEVDDIIASNASTLSEEKRTQFRERYVEERRNLEKRLREEMSDSREKELPLILEKLREEFGLTAAPVPE